MPDMRDQLHDEIDRTEEIRSKARTLVSKAGERLPDAADIAGDPRIALELIAALVEEEMASLTTEAFGLGVSFAAERDTVA